MTVEVTPELRAEIIAGLRKLRSPSKVMRATGIDLRIILPIADELAGMPRVIREEVHGGYGRPDLRDHLVGRKRAHEVWENSELAIAEARSRYEAGTHEMCTGRDGDWLLLYSIPRNEPTAPRPDAFKPEI